MEALTLALIAAGLLVGATGTWSPCGLSMIDTIGPMGHDGGRKTTLAACATFLPFAVVGGAITFGLLAGLGSLLLGSAGTAAYAVAAVVALAAALAEARGIPIVPQVRRQLPEPWRRLLPMPLAAAGYGVLLGLGFTTFILSYGVWALMGISIAMADPMLGIALGAAFGIGRAVPIVALAPIADRPAGSRVCDAMTTDPRAYRGARAGDAVALGLVAALLATTSIAQAQQNLAQRGSDPAVRGGALVFQDRDGRAFLVRGGERTRLQGTNPAAGGSYVATRQGDRIVIRDFRSLERVGGFPAKRADALAISGRFIVYRTRHRGRDALMSRAIGNPARPGKARRVARVRNPSQLSRPGLRGNLVVWAHQGAREHRLMRASLRRGGARNRKVMIRDRRRAFAGPSVIGKRVAYVEAFRGGQRLRVKNLGSRRGNVLHRTRGQLPTLWTTAINRNRVYFTQLGRDGSGQIRFVRR